MDDWVSLGGPDQGRRPRDVPGDVSYTTFASPCGTVVDPSWTPVDGGTNLTTGCISHVALVDDATVRQRILQVLAT